MTKLNWRLAKLPTPDEVRELVKDKIISQEEARDILFKDTDEPKIDELKDEIKFLRKTVEELSKGRTVSLVTWIYGYNYPSIGGWYQPYYTWCANACNTGATGGTLNGQYAAANTVNAVNTLAASTTGSGTTMYYASGGDLAAGYADQATGFSEIKTF